MAESPEPEKRNRGGQPGNMNHVRHGFFAGKLPEHLEYIEKRVNSLRLQIEQKLLELNGEVTLTEAAAINSAIKWERHGVLANHWLRSEEATMSATDRLKYSEAIAKASDARDRAIARLKLDPQDLSPWVIDAKG